MRRSRLLSAAAFVFSLLFLAPLSSRAQIADVRKSVVRVTTTAQNPDYKVPWNSGNIERGIGAGFIIAGSRIVTNAHVISNSRFVTVERENDPKKYPAKVKFVAHDCDLAVLEVNDPDFYKGLKPLEIGGIPQLQSKVSVFGYPIGGERLSVTEGIVSRIDFQLYTHSSVDSHLACQIDAAINPGNSGGPVLQNGKVVGVAFQGYSGDVAQNVGYMIATPVLQHFLQDISDGHYDHYVDLAVQTFRLQDPAEREALGLKDDDTGVLVGAVVPGATSGGVLKVGDVILAIDDNRVASDGFIQVDNERVEMAEAVERKFKGDTIKLHILRDKKEQDVSVTLEPAWQYLIQANAYDVRPRYVVFGGLVFQPLSRDFLEAYGIDDLRIRYFYDSFVDPRPFPQASGGRRPQPGAPRSDQRLRGRFQKLHRRRGQRPQDSAVGRPRRRLRGKVRLLRDQVHRERPPYCAGACGGRSGPCADQESLQRGFRAEPDAGSRDSPGGLQPGGSCQTRPANSQRSPR